MSNQFIEIKNARENNLKNVNVSIPKEKITIFTGVSGSGKSSIVFDTIAQEAGRQLNETYTGMVKMFLPRYVRPDADDIKNLSTAIVITQKQIGGNARSTLGTITDIHPLFRILFSRFAVPRVGDGYSNSYSFNDPAGMCPNCEGIGKTITLDLDAVLDKEKSLNEGAILMAGFSVGSYYWKVYVNSGFFDPDKKIKDYTEEEFEKLAYGENEKITVNHMGMDHQSSYEGLVTRFMRTNINTEKEKSKSAQEKISQISIMKPCPVCQGRRYRAEVLASKIAGYSIYDLTSMELEKLAEVLTTFAAPKEAKQVVAGIQERVQSLVDIGLGYMTLTRETPTLSGGESQRVKIVKQLSSSLTGLIYIFDEPSTGLHPRDVHRLNELLVKIRDKGNTVIIVEHDPDVIKIADYIIDVGPLAGTHGGEIMYTGDYQGLLTSGTLTGNHLQTSLPLNTNPRPTTEFLESRKSSLHNLKNISLRIPKGVFTAVTGVAGSGKSTLVNEVFLKDYADAIHISQKGIHTSKRSNSATFIGIMDNIRKLFADANDKKVGFFSHNSIGGCETCKGTGTVKLNLSYTDASEIECPTCHGSRFNPEVLAYTYQDRNIVNIMDMTIEEARTFFTTKNITAKLDDLITVGLSYLTLGQSLDTISGGEAQRLKLAKELQKKGNIYILDEPTTGLHMADVSNIIDIINMLVEKKNTVIVIEHNVDVIRSSDWIIDLGPDGGTAGGEIIYEGVPTGIKDNKVSFTGMYI